MTLSYRTLTLIRSERLRPRYHLLGVPAPDLAEQCAPGQFFELKPGSENQARRLFKPVSVYDAAGGALSFLIKIIGPGTQALADLREGDPIQLLGPLGNSFPLVKGHRVLLVSGGVGYPPLAWLRQTLVGENEVTLLHGGACAEDAFPCDESFTEDGRSGRRGLVTDGVEALIRAKEVDAVVSCGPVAMLKRVAELVKPLPHWVSLEAYMACGVGVCHGCAVPVGEGYERVCKEGPVFDASRVRWEEL